MTYQAVLKFFIYDCTRYIWHSYFYFLGEKNDFEIFVARFLVINKVYAFEI